MDTQRQGPALKSPLKRHRTRHHLSPSDPAFDRNGIPDSEYIELLVFENRELQASLAHKTSVISKLTSQLKLHGVAVPEADLALPGSNTGSQDPKKGPQTAEIAREKTANELLAAKLPLETKKERVAHLQPLQIPSGAPELVVVPQRSARRSKFALEAGENTAEETKSLVSPYKESSEAQKRPDSAQENAPKVPTTPLPTGLSIMVPAEEKTTPKSAPTPQSDRSSVYSDDTREKDALWQGPLLTPSADNTRFENRLDLPDLLRPDPMLSSNIEDDARDILGLFVDDSEINASSSTLKGTENTQRSITQHKNSSSSSFSSYISRIKLPPSMQPSPPVPQMPFGENGPSDRAKKLDLAGSTPLQPPPPLPSQAPEAPPLPARVLDMNEVEQDNSVTETVMRDGFRKRERAVSKAPYLQEGQKRDTEREEREASKNISREDAEIPSDSRPEVSSREPQSKGPYFSTKEDTYSASRDDPSREEPREKTANGEYNRDRKNEYRDITPRNDQNHGLQPARNDPNQHFTPRNEGNHDILVPDGLQLVSTADNGAPEPNFSGFYAENGSEGLYSTEHSVSAAALRSPALYEPSTDTGSIHLSILAGSKVDTPVSQVTPQLSHSDSSSFRKGPVTPDAFGPSSRNYPYPSRLHDLHNQPSQEEVQNYISSPQAPFNSSQRHLGQPEYDSTILLTPVTNNFASTDLFSRLAAQTPGSSFQVFQPKPEEEDVTLFVKPEDFHTIALLVVSTISVGMRKDDPNFTISVSDRASGKEMWRIRKSYSQLVAFDAEIRPVVEYFGLSPIPEKATFSSTTPSKIEGRRSSLQNYFNTVFLMPHIPQMVLYRICRYLSLDFVNPLDDYRSGARKEGFLVRRYKGLGTTWKVRWCQVDGPYLEIYETPGGTVLEQIRLKGLQIGRQSNDSVAEEKGYRHAFLLLESTKQSKLTLTPKHFFCAETDDERDEWISALVEFSEPGNPDTSMASEGLHDNVDTTYILDTPSSRYDAADELENLKPYHAMSLTPGLMVDQVSTNTFSSQEEAKEPKKAKKRSIFPFRYAKNAPSESLEAPVTPLVASFEPHDVSSPRSGRGEMQQYLDQMHLGSATMTKAVFGRELEEAYALSNHDFSGKSIPSICYRCINFLARTGAIYEEGIFRLSGSAASIRQLKEQFNTLFDLDLFESPLKPDMHTVAGLLKLYLRELPSPIMGLQNYHNLQNIVASRGPHSSKADLAMVFRDYLNNTGHVSAIQYDMCFVMFKFLRQIIANSSSNRMNLRNVCIVFVPTLNISLEILSLLLVDFACVFEGGKPVPDEQREVLDLQIPNF